ncbi:hypothetical protein I9W82_003615 [Candida metapsilosis]|uniref:Uncharacterized protein n=1 Tax=Candida metapsilosis TaxID=273372 RepID=A0A8H8DB58_9ASCO|nr:hypothetical protein I9W82_003615 [Candida metapsilosis]
MPQLQSNYCVREAPPPPPHSNTTSVKFVSNRNNHSSSSSNKTYLKFKAKFTKFRKNVVIKLHIVNKSTAFVKSKSPSRSRSSSNNSNSTIFVGDVVCKSQDGGDSFSQCCLEKVLPDYTVTTTECSPRISLDELQDSLVESNDEKSVSLSVDETQVVVVENKHHDSCASVVPSSPPPQYKAVSSTNDQLDTSSNVDHPQVEVHLPSTADTAPPTTPIKPSQIKFKSQLNQYLASLESEEPSEPYTSLQQYNKTTDQQYAKYQLINTNTHQCVNYYWLYLDIRQNNQFVASLYGSWYNWMSGLITFTLFYLVYACLA